MKQFYLATAFAAMFATTSVMAQDVPVSSETTLPVRSHIVERLPELPAVRFNQTGNAPLSADLLTQRGVQAGMTVADSRIGVRNAADANNIIYAVEGEKLVYEKSADGWYYDGANQSVGQGKATIETHVVFADNGDVYIKNPLTFFATNTWIKGTSDGNTITFPGKMPIYEETADGTLYVYYAQKLSFDDAEGWFVPAEGDITMTISEDGVITWEGEANNSRGWNDIIGLTDAEGNWFYYGDKAFTLSPAVEEDAPVIPEDLSLQSYRMSYQNMTEIIKMGFDGEDVYLTDLPDVSPSLVIKGKLVDGNIELPTRQYMGFNDIKGYKCYLMGLSYPEQQLIDKIVFTYDAETGIYTADKQFILFNTNRTQVEYMFYAFNAELEKFEDVAAIPADPTIQTVETRTEEYDYNGMLFTVPSTDVNGNYINTDNLYYNILIDGEVLTLTQDEYVKLPVESMTDIPYYFTDDYDIQLFSANQRLFFFFARDFQTVGVQSVYKAGGTVSKSNVVTWTVTPTGLDEVNAATTVGETARFDITGRRLSAPQKGLNIVKMSDGKVKKVLVK